MVDLLKQSEINRIFMRIILSKTAYDKAVIIKSLEGKIRKEVLFKLFNRERNLRELREKEALKERMHTGRLHAKCQSNRDDGVGESR